MARIASFIFLFRDISFVKRKFFATCCVIVDAPSNLLFCKIFCTLLIVALIIPFASTPGWLKKFLSSADKNELITVFGIDSNGIKSLFSIAYSAINFPFSEYTLLDIGGL